MFAKITNFTVGIRYTRSFRIPDISGEIVDNILRSSKSPFDSNIFGGIGTTSNEGRILYSKSNESFISISRDDIIISLDTNTPTEDFEKIKEVVIPYFKEEIFNKYSINEINRLGLIFRHKLSNKTLLDKITEEVSLGNILQPNEMIVRFSKKIKTLKGEAVHGVDDYRNAIYKFETLGDNLLFDIDYQHYLLPPRTDIRDTKPSDFVQQARNYVESKVYTWLKEHEGEPEENE